MASSIFQLISKKLVKPSFPTPSSLRNYKLSFIDQIVTNRYSPMALFFPNQHKNLPDNTSEISSLLEKSLSKTLASYYPFSGRFTDKISVNCNDMGATFFQARIKCSMSEILKEANAKVEDIVFPSGLPWSPGHDQPSLVVAQLSHFDCGGKALSVCLSHKLGDGHTLCNFINDWAAMARRQSSENPSPQFIGASILPPIDDPSICSLSDLKLGQRCVTWRRYTFDHDKLSQLKALAAEFGVQKPTRVEVVSALLYKSAMAASVECSGSFKPSLLSSMLNLRPLIGPPVTEKYTGNFFSFFPVLTTHEKEMNFSRLVSEIRREKIQHYEKYKATKTNEFLSATLEKVEQLKELRGTNDIDEYACSSLCRFPTYHIDFGWGRPIRVSLATCPYESFFVLMDNHNLDGIEALVTLQEEVMPVFQSDPELLAFASPGSSF